MNSMDRPSDRPSDPPSTPGADGAARPWIVHCDQALLVVDKPSGLPSVPGRDPALHDCAASRVVAAFADAKVVHRLDMDTSGLLLFARGLAVQRVLSRAFEQRQVGKTYIAVVAGEPADDEGEIDLPLRADWPNRPRQIVDVQAGKPSHTRWQVLQRGAGCSRLALHPLTGRSHQLRVHLAAIGHPILGDPLYAPPPARQAAGRLMLHASALTLAHPDHGTRVSFRSEPPF